MKLGGICVLMAAAAGFAGAAQAQPAAIEPFRQCAAITDNAERLACFDRAVLTANQLVTRERQRSREDFGRTDFQREQLARQEQTEAREQGRPVISEPEPVSSTAKLKEMLRDAAGRRIFLLENGQLWRETANSSLRGSVRSGETVKIERGSLSGFRLTVTGRAGFVGVRRVN